MVVHKIELSQESLIGSFTKEVTPILSVSSGDSIRFETLDAGWGTGKSNSERRKPFSRKKKWMEVTPWWDLFILKMLRKA